MTNPPKTWDMMELMEKVRRIGLWLNAAAERRPGLYDIVEATDEFRKVAGRMHFLHAGVQLSPRRAISGKKGALEAMENKMPRSTAYQLLKSLDFDSDEKLDDFRTAKTSGEVIALSPPLTALAEKIETIYAEHQTEIEENFAARKFSDSTKAAPTTGGGIGGR